MKLCAVDTETTQIDYLIADAVEVSIVPLNDDYTQDKSMKPLSVLVNPGVRSLDEGKEALAFNKIGRDVILKDGIPAEEMSVFIKGWMYANNITTILPLAHNWVFDRVVLRRLLGFKLAEEIFFRRARDSHTSACFINDKYELAGKQIPFKKTNLVFLANFFGIPNDGAHRAEFDCLMTAQVYKNLLEFPEP